MTHKRRLPQQQQRQTEIESDHSENRDPDLLHLVSLLPWNPFLLGTDAATYLAVRDFNRRRSPFAGGVNLLQEHDDSNCNFNLTVDLRNSELEPLKAVAALQGALETHRDAIAVVGPLLSAQSVLVAELAAVYGYAVLSPGSTSRTLDNSRRFPTFGRTIPTNYGDAVALCRYLTSGVGIVDDPVDTLIVVFTLDPFGQSYAADLELVASDYRLELVLVALDTKNIRPAVERLQQLRKSKKSHYHFGAFGGDYTAILVELYRNGLMGEDNFWILGEVTEKLVGKRIDAKRGTFIGMNDLAAVEGQNTALADTSEQIQFLEDLAQAVNGTGCLLLRPPPYATERMEESWRDLRNDQVEWDHYVSSHSSSDPNEDIERYFDVPELGMSIFSLFAYDAVMAIGLSACRLADHNDVTALTLFESLPDLKFTGASGLVTFDPVTKTRQHDSMAYDLKNILTKRSNEDDIITISGPEAVVIEPDEIRIVRDFMYAGGTTIPPPTNNVEENMNLISKPVISCGYAMAAVSMVLPLCAGIWTYRNRNVPCVRESQPFFLGMLCVGAVFLGSAIIPLTFQEPMEMEVLNFGCTLSPWLLATGFSLSLAALFSKIYRINRVFKSAQAFHRVKIKPKDVVRPLALLMCLNWTLLTLLTIMAPMEWVRTVTQTDDFGRPTESFALCRPQTGTRAILIPLVLVNLAALLFANYQSYLARDLPSRWNESFYVGLTNFIILETFIITVPVLVLVKEDPAPFFLVFSLSIFVTVGAVMLPAFLPKILIDSPSDDAKVLRLNQAVSAYPNARNPMGLFTGLSIRLPEKSRSYIPGAGSGAGSPIKNGGGGALTSYPASAPPAISPALSSSGRKAPLVAPVAPTTSLDTQGTSGSTLLVDGSSQIMEVDKDEAQQQSVREGSNRGIRSWLPALAPHTRPIPKVQVALPGGNKEESARPELAQEEGKNSGDDNDDNPVVVLDKAQSGLKHGDDESVEVVAIDIDTPTALPSPLPMSPIDEKELDDTPKAESNKKVIDDDDEMAVNPKAVVTKKKVAFGAPEDNQVHVYEKERKGPRMGTRMQRINALNFINPDDDSSSSSDDDNDEDDNAKDHEVSREGKEGIALKFPKHLDSLDNGGKSDKRTSDSNNDRANDALDQDYASPKRISTSLHLQNPSRLQHELDFIDMDSDETDSETADEDVAITNKHGSLGPYLTSRDSNEPISPWVERTDTTSMDSSSTRTVDA